jgi:superfamily II DNA or RNA helicase
MDLAVIVDHNICDRENTFSYSEYTKEQNEIFFSFATVFRFLIDDEVDFLEMKEILSLLVSGEFCDDVTPISKGMNREIQCVDPSVPESYFEDAFCEVFGRDILNRVSREYPILDINGGNRWIDYVIHTENGFIAIEKNGERYHHPVIIGKKKYKDQLLKQNSIVSQGGKVYRWSLGSMQFKDVFCEEIKKYFPAPEKIIDSHRVLAKRDFKLFAHQENVLEAIERERKNGKKAFLVHLPTGTGKTHILISDFFREFEKDLSIRSLVLVPSRNLKEQMIDSFSKGYQQWNTQDLQYRQDTWNKKNLWKKQEPSTKYPFLATKINEQFLMAEEMETYSISIGDSEDCKIMIQTYSGMQRRYQKLRQNNFQYIAVDEAHHSVAPGLKKIIQYFDPETLLGLTATPERLDMKKLEEIYGEYETNLTLKEAIEKEILAPIKAFRVKSNLDLSEIRYNGKDYVVSDLQRNLIVPSRDQLIVEILKKYFKSSGEGERQEKLPFKSGLIFCVSVAHAESLAKRMREHGISAKAVSGRDRKSIEYIQEYEDEKIQFLCTCSLITEGWDSPRTSIIVMARPTMSKALYLQQLGRGTRKFPGKEALYVIDVVDNYGPFNMPWSCHGIFGINKYVPWANVLKNPEVKYELESEELILSGLYEEERMIEKINIFTFEKEYPDYINTEQLARELFISTGTLKEWIRKGDVKPDIEIPFGRNFLQYFKPDVVEEIREKKDLKKHDEETIYEDFFEFMEKGDYSFSYKIIFMLSFIKCIDHTGECNLDNIVDLYSSFYLDRHEKGLRVDRPNCPFNNSDMIKNKNTVKASILSNPFEKYERKRFMYHCKDLNHIAFSSYLWQKINNYSDLHKIKNKMVEDLEDYYRNLDGVPNLDEVKVKFL